MSRRTASRYKMTLKKIPLLFSSSLNVDAQTQRLFFLLLCMNFFFVHLLGILSFKFFVYVCYFSRVNGSEQISKPSLEQTDENN